MKKVYIVMQVALLAIFAIFASCNKDENDTTIPVNNKKIYHLI